MNIYEDIIEIKEISAKEELFINENGDFDSKKPCIYEVNSLLKLGWRLLTIDASPNDDHTSSINKYILGKPKNLSL